MNNQLTQLEGHEVLQLNYLAKYPWPESDPQLTDQSVIPWTGAHHDLVAHAATKISLTPDRFLAQTAQLPVHLRLLWLIGHDAFNFNGVTRVRQEPKWITRLEQLVAAGRPIPIPYPLFCSIAHPAKQITRPGATAGELAAIFLFRRLDEMARLVYPPGLCVHILSDALLYNNALQNTAAHANAYIQDARRLVREARAESSVVVHDYAQLLAPHARRFDALYNGFYRRLAGGDPTLISGDERARLFRSVRANVNTERLGLSWADLRALFGPAGSDGASSPHPFAPTLDAMAEFAMCDQIAVKLACMTLDLPELLWPDHIRASCHRGLKNSIAVPGLRVYPEYYRRSNLLPYHGKPWIASDGRLFVDPEFTLRSRPNLTRVVNETGDSLLYIENQS